jgi:hypothetical protein
MQELEGFPIVQDGLLMTHYPGLLVVRLDDNLTKQAFDQYCEAWLRSVDSRPSIARIAAVYDLPTWPGLTAPMRQKWGAMLKSREEVLRRTTVGMALASPSAIVRTTLTGVFWIAPPPYPHKVVDGPYAAFEFAGERLGDCDAMACLRAYEQLVATRPFRRSSTRPMPRRSPSR